MIPSNRPHPSKIKALRNDRRHQRSRISRARIVAAMLDLVARGEVSPSAARVAEVAGVGLRSVFRHFTDMDALYSEMTEVIEARVLPIMLRPLEEKTWKERLGNLAGRRAEIFETIMPFRISASLRRFESPYLMQDHRRMLRLEVQMLEAQLPPSVPADSAAAQGLGVILSFATWELLRHERGLSADEARAVVQRMLADALAALPED